MKRPPPEALPAPRYDPDTYHLADDNQVLRPKRLANGARVIAYFPVGTKEGIVLAHWGDDWVTWRTSWVVDSTGIARWACVSGHYFGGTAGEFDAWLDFADRAQIHHH